LQQFALDAHAPPGATHVKPEQRGVPVPSRWHVSTLLHWPLQQSHETLHDIVASLQRSPSGLHPCGLRHTPTVAPVGIAQVTGVPEPPGSPADPQQSVSRVQTSPTTWHPLAGMQTRTPVGAYGAQSWLQHAPPHPGSPPSSVAAPPSPVPAQSTPSVRPQLAPVASGLHVPRPIPASPSAHAPLQQSAALLHTSPFCPQNDGFAHVPLLQRSEQQSELVVQALPIVLHVALSGAHVLPTQAPLQHAPCDVHERPSDVHAEASPPPSGLGPASDASAPPSVITVPSAVPSAIAASGEVPAVLSSPPHPKTRTHDAST
jgi:hypothetical protein